MTPRGVGAAWSGPPRRLFSSPLPFPVLGRFGDRRRVPPPTPAPVPVPLRASAPGDSGGTERGLADVVGRGAAPCPRCRTATVCGASAGSALQAEDPGEVAAQDRGLVVGVQFQPPANNQILVRVGLSFISANQACANAEREIPEFDFEGTRSAAEDAWRKKLSVIQVDNTGVNSTIQTVFWSGAYRAMISPQDYTGT